MDDATQIRHPYIDNKFLFLGQLGFGTFDFKKSTSMRITCLIGCF